MEFIARKYRAQVINGRLFGYCRHFYKKHKRVEYSIPKGVYSATIAKSCFPSLKKPNVTIYLDADILQQHPLKVSWREVRYAERDWKKAFRHIFMYGFSEWWCHQNSLQEKWDERVVPRDDGYELLQEIIQKQGENDIIHCDKSQKDNVFTIGSKGSGMARSYIKPHDVIELVALRAFFAYEDDRLSTICHYSGPEGVKEIVTILANQEKLPSETIEIIYNKVMSILDELVIDKHSAASKRYRELYSMHIQGRLSDMELQIML